MTDTYREAIRNWADWAGQEPLTWLLIGCVLAIVIFAHVYTAKATNGRA